jgi:hypothetical protein
VSPTLGDRSDSNHYDAPVRSEVNTDPACDAEKLGCCYTLPIGRDDVEVEMTYLQSALYLFMYLVITGVGVGVLHATSDDPHGWARECAFIVGAAGLLVAWILVSG